MTGAHPIRSASISDLQGNKCAIPHTHTERGEERGQIARKHLSHHSADGRQCDKYDVSANYDSDRERLNTKIKGSCVAARDRLLGWCTVGTS